MKNAVLRIVIQFIHRTSSFGKYLLMSCPAAKATTRIESHGNTSTEGDRLVSSQSSDLGSLPYRLLHHGLSAATSATATDSCDEDSHLLSLQILESLIRGTNQESWSPAIRSTLSQSIVTHLKTHFIQFNNSNERYSPQLVSHLLSLLCSCLLAPPTSTSLSESNSDQQPKGSSSSSSTSSSSNLHHLFTSSLTLPELIQWIDDRYFTSSSSSSHSPPPPLLLTSFYSFLSRISYFGSSEKLYSHHNRKLCSSLFTNDEILRILRRSLQSHLLQNNETVNQYGLVTLWMVLYSSESVRGKWKKLMNGSKEEEREEEELQFNWKYFLTTRLLVEGDGKEEREEKKKEPLSLTDQAILSITNLVSG
jgi:hypothetical protein